ncbi:IucA/IucC family protein [Thermopolyspora sp. NPDC052614]|uniref:IucA/IucC family protein n=1 Tax=Thermopolyspora sp. NPDC052614 TaxID=3155682 RepID=UPI00342EAB2F
MTTAVDRGPLPGGEAYLARRVLDALLREDYGGLARRVVRDRTGVALALPGGRRVRLAPGGLFQDFVVDPSESPRLSEALHTLRKIADPADAAGVAAFADECRRALRAQNLHERHRDEVLDRLTRRSPLGLAGYDALAAFLDHPVYPTARCRFGLSDADLRAYAPEFAPEFRLRWAAVPAERVTHGPASRRDEPWWPSFADVGLPAGLARSHTLFPVHPLTVAAVRDMPGVRIGDVEHLAVRPTLSMRTVEIVGLGESGAASPERASSEAGPIHLKLPLTTSTLGLRNRRSIKPFTLDDGAAAERLLRAILSREPLPVELADEQTYAHADHEYLGWMLRRHPPGEIVSVAALPAPFPGSGRVIDEVAARHHGGDVAALLHEYLTVLLTWNVRLFVRYGVALEAHQQNLALVLGRGPLRLLIKDNDGLLASPSALRAAGLGPPPPFRDERMLTDDPHALADVFVTITLHLAAAAIAFGVAGRQGLRLVREILAAALDEHGDHPMARLLRARTLDAARLSGKSMVTAGTLVDKSRTGARDVNKFYGTSGPNYLRHPPSATP